MSRRQSRPSVDPRQNDTLLEFETFKKKFLLANKHITKLNSTLSVRIEELNAQISTLYVENLRLRASEIALASQLKKEREKSRKVLADAEAATHALMKQLGHIRKSFHVPHRSSTPDAEPSPPPPPPPRARRPPPDPNASPPANRIARPPAIPGIFEEEEEEDMLVDVAEASPSPPRRKSKSRHSSSSASAGSSSSSSSRLPLPSRDTSSPVDHDLDFEEQLSRAGKKKPTRRQSGLLSTTMSITTVTPKGYKTEVISQRPPSPAFGSPLRREAGLEEEEEEVLATLGTGEHVEDDDEEEPIALSITRRDKKKKSRENEDVEKEYEGGVKREREKNEKRRSRDTDGTPGPSSYEGKKPKLKDVTNSPPPRPSLATIDSAHERERQRTPVNDIPISYATTSTQSTRSFLATPALKPTSSSHLPTPRASSPAPSPEPDAGAEPSEGRPGRRVRKSINYAEPKLNTKMRKPDPPPPPPSAVKRSSSASETAPRKSLETAASVPTSSSSADSVAAPPPVAGVKRKKSRVHVPRDDGDESDGTQADAEYGGSVRPASATGWMSTEGRRRSVVQAGSRRMEGDELRRHSMAV